MAKWNVYSGAAQCLAAVALIAVVGLRGAHANGSPRGS